MGVLETLARYAADTGFGQFHWTNGVMLAVGGLFIYLAIKKGFEPLLLLPIGFGILIGNIPYDTSKLPLGVQDGPVSEDELRVAAIESAVFYPKPGFEIAGLEAPYAWGDLLETGAVPDDEALLELIRGSRRVELNEFDMLPFDTGEGLVVAGRAVLLSEHSKLTSPNADPDGWVIEPYGQGRYGLIGPGEDRASELWSLDRQDVHNASIFWWLFAGVGLAGFYPPLIFLGIGALTDFGPMLSNPRTVLLGAAAQFGIFASLLGAIALGFDLGQAASIGIIGGADGPTAIFTCSRLAPELLGAVALAAYSYMAMVPIIQPPIIKLLTSREERMIRMVEGKPVSRTARVLFPVVGFLLTAFIAPGGLPLLGMLFLGNLLRESLVAERLVKTAQGPFIDIVTILLGVTVGAKTSASTFLTWQTIGVFALGIAAFCIATATGVLFAKALNWWAGRTGGAPLNPMIGAAGVSAVPMAARVVHKLGLQADPQNYLLMHAMGPNVAGVIGSAVAAGVLLSQLG